ncbi:pyridoxamine 5'-phosphate oxidase family protein [Couchioplanes caeruleus]|uniref:Pyridoxamine 5'-phosphate oxidase n=2 Tax=Couchioplanes caeruleus TaxID=56438 RepID=A0A1K0FIN1_9ACTN|nr:pyridoxamine 5'-phosphate oxidase family protein [Couchioplanes caeruleus]OJF12711.1 pyridoxamine 5'-phosphate oxidase [Couchioplanes caeruleus subsp. caeruleus]ROP29263.1 general stress protein 26 [Couchioplanes caeruleus]
MAEHTEQEKRDKLKELVKDARIGMLTTMTADGRHVSRPMALQDVEFDGDLWFFAYADSDLVAQIRSYPQVNVSFSDAKQHAWTSVSGVAVQTDDRAKAEELWSPPLKAWFPDGLETPHLTLVKVHAESAEYWEAAHSSRVVTLLGYVKAAVTGKTPDAGEHETVRL